MAGEIRITAETGKTLKARIKDEAGLIWNGSAMVAVSALADALWTSSLIALTEDQTSDTTAAGSYKADWPGGLETAASYSVDFYDGAAPAPGDLVWGHQQDPTEYEATKAVWDELLTGATHNIAKSAARRLRNLSSHILGPFSVTSATPNAITLDADGDLSEVAGSYDPSRIFVVTGTGSDQTGTVTEYFGTGGGNGNGARTLILKEDLKVTLDDTSEILIIISDGRASTNQGQLRGGSTTTATLNALSPNVDITGQRLHFTSGTGQDQTALVTSYTDPVATFAAIDVAVDDTTGYELLPCGTVNVESVETAALEAIADATLIRGVSNVEDTADKHSLGAMIMIGTNASLSGTTLTAKKPSDDSAFATYTVTVDAGGQPITGIS